MTVMQGTAARRRSYKSTSPLLHPAAIMSPSGWKHCNHEKRKGRGR